MKTKTLQTSTKISHVNVAESLKTWFLLLALKLSRRTEYFTDNTKIHYIIKVYKINMTLVLFTANHRKKFRYVIM